MPANYTVGKPSIFKKITNKIRYRAKVRELKFSPLMDHTQLSILENLRKDGYAVLPNFISESALNVLKSDFQNSLNELKFLETPYLDYSKIDPAEHPPLEELMLLPPDEIGKMGLAIEKSDCQNYEQVINKFNPPEITLHMLESSSAFQTLWLDPYLLAIASQYMGLVPQLAEAYVRRSFPSPHHIANNYWHRDCVDNTTHFLKIFFFFTDCTLQTGPHEYIKGSCTDKNKLETLNNKRYYYDHEVDSLYPQNSEDRVISIVPAGTVLIEDTRGLHRAHALTSGYRDLGYAVFKPMHKKARTYYKFPKTAYDNLNTFQKKFIQEQCTV